MLLGKYEMKTAKHETKLQKKKKKKKFKIN